MASSPIAGTPSNAPILRAPASRFANVRPSNTRSKSIGLGRSPHAGRYPPSDNTTAINPVPRSGPRNVAHRDPVGQRIAARTETERMMGMFHKWLITGAAIAALGMSGALAAGPGGTAGGGAGAGASSGSSTGGVGAGTGGTSATGPGLT